MDTDTVNDEYDYDSDWSDVAPCEVDPVFRPLVDELEKTHGPIWFDEEDALYEQFQKILAINDQIRSKQFCARMTNGTNNNNTNNSTNNSINNSTNNSTNSHVNNNSDDNAIQCSIENNVYTFIKDSEKDNNNQIQCNTDTNNGEKLIIIESNRNDKIGNTLNNTKTEDNIYFINNNSNVHRTANIASITHGDNISYFGNNGINYFTICSKIYLNDNINVDNIHNGMKRSNTCNDMFSFQNKNFSMIITNCIILHVFKFIDNG